MIVCGDVKGLEVVVAAYLSRDPVLVKEILDKVDIHGENQKRFNFPSRVIAKIFKFRLIYGGNEFSYAMDPEFNWISENPKYWKTVIDEYYDKYQGLHKWHIQIVKTVIDSGRLVLPQGRVFEFEPFFKKGEMQWPRTQILNYPVQGTGADLVCLARALLYRLWDRKWGDLISTVHDSIIADVRSQYVKEAVTCIKHCVEEIPTLFYRQFGVVFDLPITCEMSVGPNWNDLTEYKI